MVQNDYATTAVRNLEDDLLINWIEEESLFTDSLSHFDNRTLVLDQGLYVIRERKSLYSMG